MNHFESNVMSANNLDPEMNGIWNFSTLHHKHGRDIGFTSRFRYSYLEYSKKYYDFAEYNFILDKIVRIKSDQDFSKQISDFFADDDIFIENLFAFDWPKAVLELYDIVAPPSEIEVKSAGNNANLNGRSSDKKDGECEMVDGTLECSCAVGLNFENGQCVDIDECAQPGQCMPNEECYNYR